MKLTKYRTLLEALDQLREKGYNCGFILKDKILECLESGKKYASEDLRIVEYHRFKSASNPTDMSVVFAIRCKDGEKGTVVSSYGISGDIPVFSFLNKVKIQDRPVASGA